MRPPLAPRLLHSWLWSLASLLPLSSLAVEYPQWDGQESIEQYARRASVEPTRTLDLGNGVKLEMVLVPAGNFIMGTPEPESQLIGLSIMALGGLVALILIAIPIVRAIRQRRRPQFSLRWLVLLVVVLGVAQYGGIRWWRAAEVQARYREASDQEEHAHEVTLTKPYYLGKFEVMQEQYQQVMGVNPSEFKGRDLPVEQVSWDRAQGFCKKASEKTGLTVRLPSEAEWEHACRAGTKTTFYTGDSDTDLDRAAWHDKNSGNGTHLVGQKMPNVWGLYDMHGNVWEWCQDWYGDYSAEAATDPQGPKQGRYRVLRGGCWSRFRWFCRSAVHGGHNPDGTDCFTGFRVAASVPPKTP